MSESPSATGSGAGIDASFYDAEVERALEGYRHLVSPTDLAFMRERLLEAVTSGALRDLARRAAPRVVEESVEAPLTDVGGPEAAELVRTHPSSLDRRAAGGAKK